jgi:hypothetical protein
VLRSRRALALVVLALVGACRFRFDRQDAADTAITDQSSFGEDDSCYVIATH